MRAHLYLLASLIPVVLLGSMISGCGKTTATPSQSAKQEMVLTAMRLSSSEPPLAERDPGTKLRYNIGADGMYRATYELFNDSSATSNYALCVFVDYKQQVFSCDAVKDDVHALKLAAHEKRYYKFEIGPVAPGFHDLAVVLISYPQLHTLKEDFRTDSAASFMATYRVNLVYPANSLPDALPFTQPQSRMAMKDTAAAGGSEVDIYGLLIDNKPQLTKYLGVLTRKAKPGEKFDLYAHVCNSKGSKASFALFGQMDYRQVPLLADGTKLLYVLDEPGEASTYKISLTAPQTKGVHEFYLYCPVSPFFPLNDRTMDESNIFYSNRLAVIVE